MTPDLIDEVHSSSTPVRTRSLGYMSLIGLSCFILAVFFLHWLQPDLQPLNEAVSYYVHGAGGWMLTIGLLGLGIGSLALTVGVGRTVSGPGARAGWWLLTIWSIGAILGGIFPADPPGNWDHPSIVGMIHGNAALIAFLVFPIGTLVLAKSFRHDSRWQGKASLLLGLAIVTLLSLLAFMASLIPVMISPGPPRLLGLTERILLASYVLWLTVVAFGLVGTEERRSDHS